MNPPDADVLTHEALLARVRPRPDAADKLRAQVRYPTDRYASAKGESALHGAILGSPHPHARILAIDTSAAVALPGVHAVVTAPDIPGRTHYGLRVIDRPILCADKVRCIGDPIAAVAADTLAIARAACALIRVEYALLPVVEDPELALAADAETLHEGGNLLHSVRHGWGELEAAMQAATHVVEDEYETARQMHGYLETEGGIVEPDGAGGLIVHFACQHPARDAEVIADMLRLPAGMVRVIGTPIGGSYGGKDELTIQPVAALLAWKSGRAVRLQLSRPESVDLGVKRHPFRIRMKSGCDAQGRLLFHMASLVADTGAYATHGPEILDAAQEHAVGPYAWPALAVEGRLAYTNNGIAGAFRGFGAVQTQFALERQISRLAEACGIDGLAFRRMNLVAPDASGPMGQVVAPFDGPRRVLDVLAEHPLWQQRRPRDEGRYRHGVGLALVHRSDGFGRGGPNAARIAIGLAPDGAIEIRCGFTEMGQNLIDTVRVLGARLLGCAESDLRAVLGDSARAPDSGSTAASRATAILWRGLGRHGAEWRKRLCALAAPPLGRMPDQLQAGEGGIRGADGALLLSYALLAASLGDALPELLISLEAEETPSDIAAAHYVFGACAALAEVRVDTWSGRAELTRMVIAAALGPVISPQGFLGQMEGGAMMGAGLALTEHLPTAGGRYLARNLDGYLMPTLMDAPRFEIIAVQGLPEGDEIGPRGAGEIGVNIAAPAVAEAIAAALAMPVRRLPVLPEHILDHLDMPEGAA
ncbi:molybdopterin cofactor-binding domain-containing protein [Niveibacterium sp. SC-1]|uniref:xanthine dehydrogenase family protein molybdopterin-binding subunit n=1 Tax=Niveibacterium sp. SC-1 TaxID=3135646 RepID=UPI00311D9CAD